MHQVVPWLLIEATNAISCLLEVIPNDALLARSIVAPLSLSRKVFLVGGCPITLNLICMLNSWWPVVDLLILLKRVSNSSLKIGLPREQSSKTTSLLLQYTINRRLQKLIECSDYDNSARSAYVIEINGFSLILITRHSEWLTAALNIYKTTLLCIRSNKALAIW